jgi:hypothetical protein
MTCLLCMKHVSPTCLPISSVVPKLRRLFFSAPLLARSGSLIFKILVTRDPSSKKRLISAWLALHVK